MAWRVRVIEGRLAREGLSTEVRVVDLFELDGFERESVTNAIRNDGAEPPLLLVGSRVVGWGVAIDLDKMVDLVRGSKVEK